MNAFTYLKDPDFTEGRYYIGASDIPTLALLALNYGQTPLSLWEQKTGRAEPFKGNERTRAGKELEPLVLKWGLESKFPDINKIIDKFYLSRINGKVNYLNYNSLTESKHPDRPYLVAHADLINTHIPYIMEAKTTGYFGAKRTDDINIGYDKDDLTANGIPSSVYLQIQTQMLCYDIPTAYVSVMIDTGQHRLYGPIPAHKKTQEKILALAERFWHNVTSDTPPKPESWTDVKKLFPSMRPDSKTVIAGDELDKIIEMKEEAKAIRKKQKVLKSDMNDIRNAIGLIIGENKFLESSSGDSLASASRYSVFNLKDHKNMSPRRFNQLKKDGFISESIVDKLNY